MSLGDAYVLGVRVTGDITSLRQNLREGRTEIESFARAASGGMGQAGQGFTSTAAVAEQATNRVGQATRRQAQETQRASQDTQRATRTAGNSFQEYMQRATKAQEDVARASEDSGQRTEQSLNNVGRTLGRLTGFAGMALFARQLWQTGVGFHEFSQNSEVALSNMLGGLDQAKTFLADILEFAKQTPFSFPELTESAQQLLAMNVAAKDVIPTLRSLGDAAASQGQGIARVQQLAGIIGQINTIGVLSGNELRRLQEAGVPVLAGLANLAGVSTEEFRKMVSDGMVPADQALRDLRIVIDEGTDGINGQTIAMGGLMEQIKGSGGLTATTDSARSSFRNMAAAMTESLTPAYVGLLQIATQGMGVIRTTADGFNALPEPVRNAALAMTALTIAHRLLNTQARATGIWTSWTTALNASRASAQAMGFEIGRTRAAMLALRATAPAVGTALLGAFGGPVGLAITAVAVAVTAVSSANALAQSRVQELADTLDVQTGVLTENTNAWVANELSKEQSFGINNMKSMVDAADEMGISIDLLTAAYSGHSKAAEQAARMADMWAKENFNLSLSADSQASRFKRNLDDQINRLDAARRVVESKTRVDEAANTELGNMSGTYRVMTGAIKSFTEEQVKAQDAVAEAARRAASFTPGGLNLNIASEDDVASARDRVEQATRRVRDAEDSRSKTLDKEKLTAAERVRAEEAVGDARKALKEATDELGETEARTDPVRQYREQVQGILDATKTFVQDIQTLADQGLNAADLQSLIASGPEGSADARKALLGDPSMIDFTNEAREMLDEWAAEVDRQARLTHVGLENAGRLMGGDLGLAMRIAAEEQSADTVRAIADKLGEDPSRIYDIGRTFGLQFLSGLSDAVNFDSSMITFFNDGSFQTAPHAQRGYASGGIYPGYTPGKDVGYIGVSGGEAIMRPEWTKAMGSDYVHRMNALARTGGVGAVRDAMNRYLGGFANGGIPAPQVVTVPVSSRHTTEAPIYIDTVVTPDLADLARDARHRRSRNNMIGG